MFLVSRSHVDLSRFSARKGQEVHFTEKYFTDLKFWDLLEHEWEQSAVPITGLVNNAAEQGPVGPFAENCLGCWGQTITVDLLAPVYLCQAVLPLMLTKGYGKIINLSGGGATSPRPNYSAYATAKAGLVRFSECLAAELIGKGIDVNCVAPGRMPTRMLEKGDIPHPNAMQRAAELILFLLSDASDGITGRLIAAPWDNWEAPEFKSQLLDNDQLYTLRRVVK